MITPSQEAETCQCGKEINKSCWYCGEAYPVNHDSMNTKVCPIHGKFQTQCGCTTKQIDDTLKHALPRSPVDEAVATWLKSGEYKTCTKTEAFIAGANWSADYLADKKRRES